MAFFFLENLGSTGVIKDIPQEDLANSIWSDSSNVQFNGVQVVSASGYGKFLDFSTWIAQLRGIYGATQGGERVWYGIGTNDEGDETIVRFVPGEDPEYATIDMGEWVGVPDGAITGGIVDSSVIFASGRSNPVFAFGLEDEQELVYEGETTLFSKLRFDVVRPWNQHLWGLGVEVISAPVDFVPVGYYPKLLWISDAADPGYLPGSWEASDPATLSRNFITPFSRHEGGLVDLVPLGRDAIIYQETACHKVQYTGDFPNLISIGTVFPDFGAVGPNCVVAVKNQHVVFSDNDIVIHNGYEAQSLLSNRMRSWLYSRLSSTMFGRSFLVPNYAENEVYICYVEQDEIYPKAAIVWNYEANTMYPRDLPGVAVGYGIGSRNSSALEYADNKYTTVLAMRDGGVYRPGLRGGPYISEEVDGELVKTPLHCYVERTGFAIRTDDTPPHSRTLITEVWPELDAKKYSGSNTTFEVAYDAENVVAVNSNDTLLVSRSFVVESGGIVDVWVGGSLIQKGPMKWYGPYAFEIGKQDFIPVLVEGIRHALWIEWENGLSVSFSRVGFAYEVLGRF